MVKLERCVLMHDCGAEAPGTVTSGVQAAPGGAQGGRASSVLEVWGREPAGDSSSLLLLCCCAAAATAEAV